MLKCYESTGLEQRPYRSDSEDSGMIAGSSFERQCGVVQCHLCIDLPRQGRSKSIGIVKTSISIACEKGKGKLNLTRLSHLETMWYI